MQAGHHEQSQPKATGQRAMGRPTSLRTTEAEILALQASVGNRAVGMMLDSLHSPVPAQRSSRGSSVPQRLSDGGHEASSPIQRVPVPGNTAAGGASSGVPPYVEPALEELSKEYVHVTSGKAFNPSTKAAVYPGRLSSGTNSSTPAIEQHLKQHSPFKNQNKIIPATHVETTYAWMLINNAVSGASKHLDVVVNNPICDQKSPGWGCIRAIPLILPDSSWGMRIFSPREARSPKLSGKPQIVRGAGTPPPPQGPASKTP